MSENERIVQVIFSALDKVNQELPKGQQLEKSADTVLYDDSGVLDSLGLVTLIVAIEEGIEEEFEVIVALANEKSFFQKVSPFKTVETLVGYISSLLEESANE